MLKKLLQYKEWTLIILLVAGWVSTILYYGKNISDMQKSMDQMNTHWQEQLVLNGKILMYIEMDSK
jgi:hypothetical protein